MVIEDDLCLKLSFQSFVGTGEWRNSKACLEQGEEITDHRENSKGSKETSSKKCRQQRITKLHPSSALPLKCMPFRHSCSQHPAQPGRKQPTAEMTA